MTGLNIGRMALPPRMEVRDSVADRIIAARLAQATGGFGLAATAAVEIALGLWERAFMSARCDAMTPAQLALLGRNLLRTGESTWRVVPAGRLRRSRLEVVSSADMSGESQHPSDWRWNLTIPAPTTTRTYRGVSGLSVVRVALAPDPANPWRGVGPFSGASLTRAILEALESRMGEESAMPVGAVLPVPKTNAALAEDLANLAGRVVLGETMAGGWGAGDSARAPRDWVPSRIGGDVPAGMVSLRTDIQTAILAVAGVPGELVGATGSDAREAWRRFLHGTIAPVGRLLSAELRRVGLPDGIHFDELFASDLQGRARAFKSLRDAGLDEGTARRVCGIAEPV